jgi:hypothetical protein
VKYETIMEQERNKQLAEQADLIDGLKAEIFELSNKLELEEAGRKVTCFAVIRLPRSLSTYALIVI